MSCSRYSPILPLLALVLLAQLLMLPPAPAAAALSGAPALEAPAPSRPSREGSTSALPSLEQRLTSWPAWSLPAPLQRPGREDLIWPAWFRGEWEVSSTPAEGAEPPLRWRARFQAESRGGGAVADRAFNAGQIGAALLGDGLISVRNDPANPNRQVSLLRGDRQLESTVVGRRSARPDGATFLADELTLQVLHGPGTPRISRVEVLGLWQRLEDGSISGEQWLARYASPAAGLAANAEHPQRFTLRLVPLPPGSDPAS